MNGKEIKKAIEEYLVGAGYKQPAELISLYKNWVPPKGAKHEGLLVHYSTALYDALKADGVEPEGEWSKR